MEMRPRYRGRVDSDEMVYLPPTRKDARSIVSEDSGITITHGVSPQIRDFAQRPQQQQQQQQRELRDVVEEARYELLNSPNPSNKPRFELASKEELLDANTTAMWSTSLFDSEDSSGRLIRDDSSAPSKDISSYDPRRVRENDEDDIIIRKKCFDDAIDSRTVETTVMSFQSDEQTAFSSSCSLFPHEWRDQGIFCCGMEIGEDVSYYADNSNALVESAATGLLHQSILKSADDFFSDQQAESLRQTLSEVSEELDQAGNKVVDLTAMLNVINLCVRKEAVQVEQVKSDCSETVPSEVSFKIRVLSKHSTSNNNKSSTWVKKHPRPPKKVEHKKGMFRKFFRKCKSAQ